MGLTYGVDMTSGAAVRKKHVTVVRSAGSRADSRESVVVSLDMVAVCNLYICTPY